MSTEKQIPILCLESYQTNLWPLSRVLEEINRDRSPEWIEYTENDWQEGWDEWVEGNFYSRKTN
jgi:hypothetical protein